MYLEPLGLRHCPKKNRVRILCIKNNYKRAIKQLGWKTPFQFEESIKVYPKSYDRKRRCMILAHKKRGDLERHKRIKIYK